MWDGGSALPASPKLHGSVVVLRDDSSPVAAWERSRLVREGISTIYKDSPSALNNSPETKFN